MTDVTLTGHDSDGLGGMSPPGLGPERRAWFRWFWSPNTAPIQIAGGFCVLNGILLTGGIRAGADSAMYVNAADSLLHGNLLAGRPGGWLAYKAVIALCMLVGVGLKGVVIIQLAAAAAAAAAVFDMVRRRAGERTGLFAAALIAINPELARWHHYILSDSLYTSFLVLSMWAVDRTSGGGTWSYLRAGSLLIVTVFIRPNGWLLVPVVLVYWCGRVVNRRAVRWGIAVVVVTISTWGALRLAAVLRQEPYQFIRQGRLQGMSSEWVVRMPEVPDPSEPSPPQPPGSWSTAFQYIRRHPLASTGLALARVGVEMSFVRPHYSARHNVTALLFAMLLYGLGIRGFLRLRREPFALMLTVFMALHMLPVVIRGADWDARYADFVLPLVCVFTGCGAPKRFG